MKQKLTLLLLALFTTVGAWAAVTDLPEITTDANNPKLYVVKNTRSNFYMAYRGDAEQIRQSADISTATLWYFTAGSGESNETQKSVRFRNYFADGKAIYGEPSSLTTEGYDVTIKKTDYSDAGLAVQIQNVSWYYLNDAGQTAITKYYHDDPGSVFVFIPLDDFLEDLRTQYSALVDGCETLTALFSSSDCATAKTAITNATTGLAVISAYESLIATANNKLITLKSFTGQKYIVMSEGLTASDSESSVIRVVTKRDLLALQNSENGYYVGLSPTSQSEQFKSSTTPEYFQMKFNGSYSGYACFASSNARTSARGTLTMHQSGNSIVTWGSDAANSFFQPASKTLADYKTTIKAKLDVMSGWQPIYAADDIATAKTNVDGAATLDAAQTIYKNAVLAANGKLLSIENYDNAGKYMSINATNVTNRDYPTVIKLLVNEDLTYSLQGYLNFSNYYAEQLRNVNDSPTISSTTAGKYRLGKVTNGFIFYSSQHNGCLHYSNGNVVRWYDNSNASYWTVSDVDDAAYLGSYYNAILPYQSNYGQYGYYKSGSTTKDLFDDAISACETILGDLEGQSSSVSMGKTVAKGIYDTGFTPVVPQAGDFLRIKASDVNKTTGYGLGASNLYLTSSNCASQTDRAGFAEGATATDNTTIFYYNGTNLTGFANGLQAKMNGSNMMQIGSVGNSPTVVGFEEIYGTEDHAYRIEFNNGGRSLYTQRGGSEGSYYYYTDAAGANATDPHYRYFLEKVTTLPVTISAAGYATLYSPVALTIPTGVTAYVATNNTTYLSLTAIDGGIIPANTGVILAGSAGTYDFEITTGGSADSNALSGTVAAIARPSGSYILATGKSGIGFYGDGASTIPGFKAYLPEGAGVKGFIGFEFDDATGLNSFTPALFEGEGAIFNVAGQRLNKMQKGINIVNGKKVMVK